MSNEIDRFDKPRHRVKIVGAVDVQVPEKPQILDRTTKQEPISPEISIHTEEVHEDDKLRVSPREPDEPQVRIRSSDQQAWEKAKRDD